MKAEGLFDDTLFIFTADHGEYFGEHRVFSHNPPGHVQDTGVPLILYHHNRIPQRLRVEEPVQLLDIMPTILDFAERRHQRPDDAGRLARRPDRRPRPRLLEARVVASEEVTTRDRIKDWRNTRSASLRLAVSTATGISSRRALSGREAASCRSRCG